MLQVQVHEVLSQSAKELLYNQDREYTSDDSHPDRGCRRKVECKQKSCNCGTEILDRNLFMHQFFVNVLRKNCCCCCHNNKQPCMCVTEVVNSKEVAGNRAMITHSMILPVVSLERICGEDDTFNCSLTFVHLFLSILFFLFVGKCGFSHRSDCLLQLSLSRTYITTGSTFYTFKTIEFEERFFVMAFCKISQS